MKKTLLSSCMSISKTPLLRHILPSTVVGRGNLKFCVHGGQRLYEFVPTLCAEGKVQEIVGNLLFRSLDVLRDGPNDGSEMLQEFFHEVYKTLECLFSPSPLPIPHKEMVFTILNADVIKIVSPKLRNTDAKKVQEFFESIFYQFFIQHTDMKSSVCINSLFLAIGISRFLFALILVNGSNKLRHNLTAGTFSTLLYQYLYGKKPQVSLAIQLATFFAAEENGTLDTPLLGSCYTLKTVLKTVVEKRSEELLDYFMKCLPHKELKDEVIQLFESRNLHTGLLFDEWSNAVTRKHVAFSPEAKTINASNTASNYARVDIKPHASRLLKNLSIHPTSLEVNYGDFFWKRRDLLAQPIDLQETELLTLYEMQLNQRVDLRHYYSTVAANRKHSIAYYQLPLSFRKIYWINNLKRLSTAFNMLKHSFSFLYHKFGTQKADESSRGETFNGPNAFVEEKSFLDTSTISITFDSDSCNHPFLVVALDVEWTAPNAVSLLTIATKEFIFIIDMLNSDISYRNIVTHVLSWLFKNPFIIKLMYDHSNDIRQLFFSTKFDPLLGGVVNCIDLREPRILQLRGEINTTVNKEVGKLGLVSKSANEDLGKVVPLFNTTKAYNCNVSGSGEFLNKLQLDDNYIFNHKPASPFYRSTILKCRSLSHLSETVLNLTLDKSLQLSNWNTRPLSISQLEYAASDAYILLMLEVALREQKWFPSKIIGKTHPQQWNV